MLSPVFILVILTFLPDLLGNSFKILLINGFISLVFFIFLNNLKDKPLSIIFSSVNQTKLKYIVFLYHPLFLTSVFLIQLLSLPIFKDPSLAESNIYISSNLLSFILFKYIYIFLPTFSLCFAITSLVQTIPGLAIYSLLI